ncbi:hypothetical protein LTR12_011107 [Friedmanniomyces endolithicus]|nr:hypothetical protein LTR74_011654 [Friedmanniomyces endolithicus]KAK1814467.1 hypothetical protein LTR12_011107 [Friedmanniomyces endolithicus]
MPDSLMTPLVNDESTKGLVFDAYIRRPTVNSRAADSDRAEGMSDQDQQFGVAAATDNKTEIPHRSPYDVGNTLSVILHKNSPITADVKILELHGPSTYSTVLSVSVPGHLLGSTEPSVRAILKICDRRFAEGYERSTKSDHGLSRRSGAMQIL